MTILEAFRVPRMEPHREIGIEIEAEGKHLHFQETIGYWNQTHDGSLRGHAIEYVLKQPCNREQVTKRLRYLKTLMSQQKGEIIPSDRAGVHVHVNCQHNTFWEVMNFACLYLILEHPMIRYCGPDREGNLFCLRAEDAEYLLEALCAAVEHESFNSLQVGALRYASINFTSLSKYGSLEFRGLRTPADIMAIKEWVDMLLLLKDAASRYQRPMEIIESMSGAGPKGFLAEIMGPYASKLRYKGYEKDLWQGVRLVQDVAFTRTLSPSERATGTRPAFEFEDGTVRAGVRSYHIPTLQPIRPNASPLPVSSTDRTLFRYVYTRNGVQAQSRETVDDPWRDADTIMGDTHP
jgi:hypothetical protein